ncbi:hypothetical protein J4Q44_G00069560 [Coregonus suidteri]|uniref:Uncharacterized protein n=1 Tax=Coregonus suidteri TaxID=861788 RepID=A0AAN8M4U9_9TELE
MGKCFSQSSIQYTCQKHLNTLVSPAMAMVMMKLKTWRRTNEEEMKKAGTTWNEVKKTAQTRVHWRVEIYR